MSIWKRKFENFERAFLRLKEVIDRINTLTLLEKEGVVQRFEYVFELAWKVMKAYLEEQGFEVKSPKNTIRVAFQVGLIDDGDIWMKALQIRNLTSHTYNEEILDEAISFIWFFFSHLEKLYWKLKDEW